MKYLDRMFNAIRKDAAMWSERMRIECADERLSSCAVGSDASIVLGNGSVCRHVFLMPGAKLVLGDNCAVSDTRVSGTVVLGDNSAVSMCSLRDCTMKSGAVLLGSRLVNVTSGRDMSAVCSRLLGKDVDICIDDGFRTKNASIVSQVAISCGNDCAVVPEVGAVTPAWMADVRSLYDHVFGDAHIESDEQRLQLLCNFMDVDYHRLRCSISGSGRIGVADNVRVYGLPRKLQTRANVGIGRGARLYYNGNEYERVLYTGRTDIGNGATVIVGSKLERVSLFNMDVMENACLFIGQGNTQPVARAVLRVPPGSVRYA